MDRLLLAFEKNKNLLKKIFEQCSSAENRYKKIIELGSELPPIQEKDKVSENLVKGCQSQLYLKADLKEGLFLFTAHSDALISKGLAAVLYKVYNGMPPDIVLKCPPTFLKELEITTHLSPSRSNGVASLYLKMQQLAVKFLITDPV